MIPSRMMQSYYVANVGRMKGLPTIVSWKAHLIHSRSDYTKRQTQCRPPAGVFFTHATQCPLLADFVENVGF